jgi:hypothetical protein
MMVDYAAGGLHQGRQGASAGRGQRHAPAAAARRADLRRTGYKNVRAAALVGMVVPAGRRPT